MSFMYMRMHPCEAAVPTEPMLLVPWNRMPEALRSSARVPRGLPGPGGMNSGMLADHEECGFVHVGRYRLLIIFHHPSGVGYPGMPTAIGYVTSSVAPLNSHMRREERRTTMVLPMFCSFLAA